MKEVQDTPTAEILAQWEKLTAIAKHPNYARDWNFDKPTFEGKIASIAAELDRRCEELGLFIIEGSFVYAKCVNGDGPFRNWYGVVNPADWVRITAKEQYDLESWLLTKGGNRA